MKISLLSLYPDVQSFGLRTISSCLKREGHKVHIQLKLKKKKHTSGAPVAYLTNNHFVTAHIKKMENLSLLNLLQI